MPTLPRRQFLRRMLAGAAGLGALGWAGWWWLGRRQALPPDAGNLPPGRLLGPNHMAGHRLREGGLHLPQPAATRHHDVLVLGGGMAGLSAAWWLRRHGVDDLAVLDLEAQPGGNSASGQNAVSAYPWGAHYLPVPSAESRHVRLLCEELGLITGYDAQGRPLYDDYALVHDPDERLLRHGVWQEGLLPQVGVTDAERRQYQAFFAQVDAYKTAYGRDGRPVFAIPVAYASTDEAVRALDRISFSQWLDQQGLTAPPLRWYLDYACRDDYGANLHTTSAYAGLHYFAARRGTAANAEPDAVLTWPAGNGHLVQRLAQPLGPRLHTGQLALRIYPGERPAADVLDLATGTITRWTARHLVVALPQFVVARLLPGAAGRAAGFDYAPWLVANVTVDTAPLLADPRGAALAWDNVAYGRNSLGYVVATHQNLARVQPQTVLTWYHALTDASPAEARQALYGQPYEALAATVLRDLDRMHPGIRDAVHGLDVWVWGHGMVRPTPGFLTGAARTAAAAALGNVHFAHSDLSGMSVFEEAQYHGVRAAEAVLRALGQPVAPAWRV